MVHLIPTHQTASAADTARLILENVTKHQGVPDSIISDRLNSQVISGRVVKDDGDQAENEQYISPRD